MDVILEQRARALEDAFFKKRDDELIAAMRKKEAEAEKKQALAEASGITDVKALEELVAHGVHAEALAALALVPVVEVVWADGHLHKDERAAVMRAIERHGIALGSPAHTLVEQWMAKRPAPLLLTLWKSYVETLMPTLAPEAQQHLRESIINHAREVAESAGGFLGLARVSTEEQAVLDDMEKALTDASAAPR